MKKSITILLCLMACILIPNITKGKEFSTLGAGTWDYVGQRRFTVSFSEPIYSGGGDFMVKLGYMDFSSNTYHLYEYDPNNSDDFVGKYTFSTTNKEWILRDIGNFVDGDNGKAEFYLVSTRTDGSSYFVFYD